jgi:hypothetical protein
MKRTFLLYLTMQSIAVAAIAQRFEPGFKVVYYHAKGAIQTQTLAGKEIDETPAGSGKALEVHGAQTVPIWIADPNPVLYTYTWKGVTYEQNADYAAALAFAKIVQPIGGLLGRAQPQGFREVGDAFVTAVETLRQHVNAMPDIARLTLGTDADITRAKQEVAAWDLAKIESVVNDTYTQLHKVDASAFESGTDTDAASVSERAIKLVLALAQETQLRQMLQTAKTFKAAVIAVNVPVKLGEAAVDFKQNATAHLNIATVPAFDAIAKQSRRAVGDVAFPMKPYYAVHLSMSPALVYSFVKAPQFTTRKNADGTYQIVENKSDYRGTNVSAMLTLTPRGWAEAIGGAFQIGVSPVKDQIGFFGGVQLRLADLIRLGTGLAYQQVPRLSQGLNVATPIASPDALKTESHFKGGAYLSLEVKLP